MTDTTAENTTPEAIQFKLEHLRSALNLIDVAIERGAYKANEISSVGNVRDTIEQFLEAVDAASANAQVETTETEASE